ncbi:MAG: hypothetical protein KAH23_08770 [Kiritimatiellae bacterium]|nr:hypothetical protein [Kiritimatiellia bacterium]
MRIRIPLLCILALVASSVSIKAQDIVCFEAETTKSIVAPMRLMEFKTASLSATNTAVKGASGNKYIETPKLPSRKSKALLTPKTTTPQKGHAVFTVNIPVDGKYYLWCRTWWTGECGNSFTIIIDNKQTFTFGEDGTFRCWHWVKHLKIFNLSKGDHTLKIKQRESGAKLDQILFVNHHRYVPVGIEKTLTGTLCH